MLKHDPNAHPWKFFRSGGFAQVRLETGEDLRRLGELDQKLWSALSCPVRSLGRSFDTRTLELIDTDHDDRIRAPELLEATRFACALLKDPGLLTQGRLRLELASINDATPEGHAVLASARRLLENLQKPDAIDIGVEELADTIALFSAMKRNGDGVVPPASVDEPEWRAVAEEIVSCVGSVFDRNGEAGLNREKLDAFFAAAEAFSAWWEKAEAAPEAIFPLGANTAAAAELLDALRPKVEDYFTRVRLAGYDPRAANPLNRSEADFQLLGIKLLSSGAAEVADFPLALVEAAKPLPLTAGLNPAWAEKITRLSEEIVTPLLGGREALTQAQWEELDARFGAFRAWNAEKTGAEVEPLGIARVRELLAGKAKDTLGRIIEEDEALKPESDALESLERLVRYHRDLFTLLNNFVSFRDFYSRRAKAIFQAGTLYLDGRSMDLCIPVEDVGAHAAMAGLSRTYLVYCELKRRGSGEAMNIVAALTDGDSDRLMPGRNGIFYDRHGLDWDATVVKIIDHPISIRQGFWSPYRKVGKMIGDQIEKFATAREKAVQESSAGAVTGAAKVAEAGKPPPQPFDVGKFAGIFAAIGLAVGAIGTAVASVVTGFMGLTWWKMPLALCGLMLAISGPSMLIAAFHLRHRSLAPLLDANGWAVNTRAKVNIAFGKSLTTLAKLPEGAGRDMADPFAEKRYLWAYVLALAVVLGLAFLIWKFKLVAWWMELMG